ncbi:MAG: nucleotidyl transferase AbiEii/AbiGii toxin family protein [bacterium]
MTSAFDRLVELLQALTAESVAFVLIGGQAINLHGILRFTEDIDLFVKPTTDNVERLRRALRRVWDDAAIAEIQAQDLAGDYAVVRYGTPDGFAVDLIARVGEMFCFEDVESEMLPVGGVAAPVATPRMLYRMKRGTVRPVDRADAADLQAKFHLRDED